MEPLKNKILVIGGGSEALIKEITQTNDLASCVAEFHLLRSFPWTLETKYYSAPVEFWMGITFNHPEIRRLADSVEALIIIMNFEEKDSFDNVKSWLPFIEEHNPSLLICFGDVKDRSSPPNISTEQHQVYNQWCVDNGIEYVSILKWEEDELQDERFKSRTGIDRIRESLSTNMWPNMVTKNASRIPPDSVIPDIQPSKEDIPIKTEDSRGTEEKTVTEKKEQKKIKIPNPFEKEGDSISDEEFGAEDEDDDFKLDMSNFEKTLRSIGSLRANAQNLSDQDRRALAAKVAMSFMSNFEDDEGDE